MAERGAPYDYQTALKNVQARIQRLAEVQARHAQPRSSVRDGVRFWRAHWGSVAVLASIYSMSTATVVANFFTERQLHVRCLGGREGGGEGAHLARA